MDWTFFLACIISVSAFVAGQTPKYALKGTWEQFKPDISGEPSSILWKHNGDKVVEFDGSAQQVFGSYENRITLGWITAELEITDLRIEDSGDYELEVFINNNLHTKEYRLEVIDKVAKPTISCEINKGSGLNESEGQATLLCSTVQPESLVKFEWRSQGISYPGDKITFSLKDQKDVEEYTCVVSNPLSSETATFTVKDCNQENSSLALIIALSILALIVVGAALGVLFCRMKQKACFANDEEKQKPESKNRTPESEPLVSADKSTNRADYHHGPDREVQGNVKEAAAKYDKLVKENEPKKAPVQEKALSDKIPAPDESPHPAEAPPDIPVHTENEDNKEPEVTEETAETTTGPDSSSEQRSSGGPGQKDPDTPPPENYSSSSGDGQKTEESKQQNQVTPVKVKEAAAKYDKLVKENEPKKAPAAATPAMLDDEGGQDGVPNKSLQDKASHSTEAVKDTPAHAESKDNKKQEVPEETAGTTTEPNSSSEQRSSGGPEQKDPDTPRPVNHSSSSGDGQKTEESKQQNQVTPVQEKALSDKIPAPDESPHPAEAPPDIPVHTENEDNKEPEVTEETAGTTTGPDSSSEQRSSGGPGQKDPNTPPPENYSSSSGDGQKTEESKQQNQVTPVKVKEAAAKYDKLVKENEPKKAPAAATPAMLDDEGGQDGVPNKSLQDKASHSTEAIKDTPAHAESKDNKKQEVPEETAGTTTEPNSSSEQRSSGGPEQKDPNTPRPVNHSSSSGDGQKTEESKQQNQVTPVQEKALSDKIPAPDESPHPAEAPPDIPVHTENEDNKEPEVTEETAGTTTGPDSSSEQRSSGGPEQKDPDTPPPENYSSSSGDGQKTEESKQQNQVTPVKVKEAAAKYDKLIKENEPKKAPVQEKALSGEIPAPDESPHPAEAPPDIPAHTENEDNKEPEITEETAGTTTGPDSSSTQRSSPVPEQEDTDTTPFKKDSDSSEDEGNA